jgi:hypothetical protein
MAKTKRKQIEELLYQVYDKGLHIEDCNMTGYYEKILKALNISLVSKSAKSKSKIKVDDLNSPWNWKKDNSEL